jgi:hypothetical protein
VLQPFKRLKKTAAQEKMIMDASWFFPLIAPHRVQGRGLAEDNFAAEERKNEEIMGREGYQNALDARQPGSVHGVRVVLRILNVDQIDGDYLQKLITPEYGERLQSATESSIGLDFTNTRVLVVEDFGTTGLEGAFVDSTVDGDGENWNAFWFREGEGAKSGRASNGRAGQGKVTFYRIGRSRAVFGLTIRQSDSKELLMGRSSFRRDYSYNEHKYERDSFWCFRNDEKILPMRDPAYIKRFRESFNLQRTTEPGLSLVIPFPLEFSMDELVRTAIADFYLPIARTRLEVQIGDELINASNLETIADKALTDAIAREFRSSFTKGFRSMVRNVLDRRERDEQIITVNKGWEKTTTLKEDSFPEGAVESLRSALNDGQLISARFPLTVRPKQAAAVDTWFDVYLELPDKLERFEEAYIRRDLLIGSERHLAGLSYLPKARALTLIEQDTMSAFLADAEEPTHLKWNASRPRLSEDYKSPKELVKAVRHALPRLLTLLSGGDPKRDVKALAKYFTKATLSGTKHTPGGRKEGVDTTVVIDPPQARRKPFRLDTDVDSITVRPNGNAAPKMEDLPIDCTLETAYEGLDQDPFGAYDPFDFDLSDAKAFKTSHKGVSSLVAQNNLITFEIVEPDFEVSISGFDPHIRLRARMTFEEKENGPTVDTE